MTKLLFHYFIRHSSHRFLIDQCPMYTLRASYNAKIYVVKVILTTSHTHSPYIGAMPCKCMEYKQDTNKYANHCLFTATKISLLSRVWIESVYDDVVRWAIRWPFVRRSSINIRCCDAHHMQLCCDFSDDCWSQPTV